MNWNKSKKGKLRKPHFLKGYEYEHYHAKLLFTPTAWVKMQELVKACPVEIAWRGLTKKISDRKFLVYDILTFPQYVAAAATDTDAMEDFKWLCTENKPDDPIFFHGHSHVNMPVFRSGTDAQYQKDVIRNIKDDGYYVFAIVNKHDEVNVTIVNKAIKMIWDTEHHNVDVDVTGMDLFRKEAMAKVRPMSAMPVQHKPIDEFANSATACDELDEEMLEKFTLEDPWARNEV